MQINPIFNRDSFFIKESTTEFTTLYHYDVLDTKSKALLLQGKEAEPNLMGRAMRLIKAKKVTAFDLSLFSMSDERILHITKDTLSVSRIEIKDGNDNVLGYVKKEFENWQSSLGLFDTNNQKRATIGSDWMGWNFTFDNNEQELGKVTQKADGVIDFFLSPPHYQLDFSKKIETDSVLRPLMLATVISLGSLLR